MSVIVDIFVDQLLGWRCIATEEELDVGALLTLDLLAQLPRALHHDAVEELGCDPNLGGLRVRGLRHHGRANSQLLLKGYCGELPDEALDVIMKISSRCRRLASQIQDMLQLANLNSISRDSLDWAELDLAEVLTWCVKQALPMAEERRISIQTDIQPAMARGVEDHVKMCLSNLIANACSYSREGGCVEVKCSPRHGGGAIVTVQDNGIGIARDKLPHIFDEYYRTEEAVMHNKDSTGLGLAIVRHVARSHNLRIQVDSEPAKGTRFTVEFRSRQRLGNVSKTQMEV